MFNSGNFDTDNYLTEQEKRRELEKLHWLGSDCDNENQYAKAEKFYQRAVELAESLDDLSLMLRERWYLSTAQRLQGKYKAALSSCTWLMEFAYNPNLNRELTEYDLWYVAQSFIDFVEIGTCLPDMKVADLERVLDRGLDWLNSIGKRDWTAGFRFVRGQLWSMQKRYQDALAELEAALALARRYPNSPGFALGAYLFQLGYLLMWYMYKPTEAEVYHREVVEGYQFGTYCKHRSLRELAYICLEREDFAEAEALAQQALELALPMEYSHPAYASYILLGKIFWKQKRIDEAIRMKILAWHYARLLGTDQESIYFIYKDIAKVRIYQGQQNNPQRYIPKARRWLRWILPLAVRLDRQVGLTKCQDEIGQLQAECEAILAGTG